MPEPLSNEERVRRALQRHKVLSAPLISLSASVTTYEVNVVLKRMIQSGEVTRTDPYARVVWYYFTADADKSLGELFPNMELMYKVKDTGHGLP